MRIGQRVTRTLAYALLPQAERARLRELHVNDAGHGYDALGMHRSWVALAAALLLPAHRHYFRVQSHGAENIPQRGPAILVANHGGILPFDAAMLCMDVLEHTSPARLLRPAADFFVPKLPFIGTLLSRMGTTNGTASNLRHLLENDELVLIFPEGLRAIGKARTQAYQLQDWGVGHAELALRHGVPIVPVAIIGAEEQWRELLRLPLPLLNAPYVPIPWPPLPMPVRYHIHYGAALRSEACSAPEPAQVDALASATRKAVANLLRHGLAERRGVFR